MLCLSCFRLLKNIFTGLVMEFCEIIPCCTPNPCCSQNSHHTMSSVFSSDDSTSRFLIPSSINPESPNINFPLSISLVRKLFPDKSEEAIYHFQQDHIDVLKRPLREGSGNRFCLVTGRNKDADPELDTIQESLADEVNFHDANLIFDQQNREGKDGSSDKLCSLKITSASTAKVAKAYPTRLAWKKPTSIKQVSSPSDEDDYNDLCDSAMDSLYECGYMDGDECMALENTIMSFSVAFCVERKQFGRLRKLLEMDSVGEDSGQLVLHRLNVVDSLLKELGLEDQLLKQLCEQEGIMTRERLLEVASAEPTLFTSLTWDTVKVSDNNLMEILWVLSHISCMEITSLRIFRQLQSLAPLLVSIIRSHPNLFIVEQAYWLLGNMAGDSEQMIKVFHTKYDILNVMISRYEKDFDFIQKLPKGNSIQGTIIWTLGNAVAVVGQTNHFFDMDFVKRFSKFALDFLQRKTESKKELKNDSTDESDSTKGQPLDSNQKECSAPEIKAPPNSPLRKYLMKAPCYRPDSTTAKIQSEITSCLSRMSPFDSTGFHSFLVESRIIFAMLDILKKYASENQSNGGYRKHVKVLLQTCASCFGDVVRNISDVEILQSFVKYGIVQPLVTLSFKNSCFCHRYLYLLPLPHFIHMLDDSEACVQFWTTEGIEKKMSEYLTNSSGHEDRTRAASLVIMQNTVRFLAQDNAPVKEISHLFVRPLVSVLLRQQQYDYKTMWNFIGSLACVLEIGKDLYWKQSSTKPRSVRAGNDSFFSDNTTPNPPKPSQHVQELLKDDEYLLRCLTTAAQGYKNFNLALSLRKVLSAYVDDYLLK